MTKKKVETIEISVLPESPTPPTSETVASVLDEVKAETPPLTEQIQRLVSEAPLSKRWTTLEMAKLLGVGEMEAVIAWHNLYGYIYQMNTRLYKA
jgi:hypothetical protein